MSLAVGFFKLQGKHDETKVQWLLEAKNLFFCFGGGGVKFKASKTERDNEEGSGDVREGGSP